MNRCIDLDIGQKILSYDLLDGVEKRQLDSHLEHCPACRDFLRQTLGKEGAFDDLALRSWRMSRRQRVEPHLWIQERLHDLWLPFLLIAVAIGSLVVWVARRGPDVQLVQVRRFAIMRPATLDSLATPHIDPAPEALVVRTDRDARVYVYEIHDASLRRILPAASGTPPAVGPGEASELHLPKLESAQSRLLVVLVPAQSGGSLDDWDTAVFAQLRGGKNPQAASLNAWPEGAHPTLRWYP
jgi:hypothetical protein